jgi:hypothetical protein
VAIAQSTVSEEASHPTRRQTLGALAAAFVLSLLRPCRAASARDLRFRVLYRGKSVGTHSVTFQADGERLIVVTHIDITVKVLFFTAFRLRHDAEEVWLAGRLDSVKSTTDDNGTQLKVSGYSAGDGFRIIGEDGPFLAAAGLLTSNTLWDRRLVHESRMIDVQHGGEVGLVARLIGEEQVDTPQGPVRATRYQMITPHYAGTVFYDAGGRWVKGVIEQQGESLEYALES